MNLSGRRMLVLDNDTDDAERRTTQGEGIARARRLLADRPEDISASSLSASATAIETGAARATVIGTGRRIVIADGVGDSAGSFSSSA